MKRFLYLTTLACVLLSFGCEKESSINPEVETSTLQQKKDTETPMYSSSNRAQVDSRVQISGDTYLSSHETSTTWQYTGSIPNVTSVEWWYKKVGDNAASYLIGRGTSATFDAIADNSYSNTSHRTSDFIIYAKVHTSDGNTFRGYNTSIMKKGKWKLVRGLSGPGDISIF